MVYPTGLLRGCIRKGMPYKVMVIDKTADAVNIQAAYEVNQSYGKGLRVNQYIMGLYSAVYYPRLVDAVKGLGQLAGYTQEGSQVKSRWSRCQFIQCNAVKVVPGY